MPRNEKSMSDPVSGMPSRERCRWWICQRPSSKFSTITRGPPDRRVTKTVWPITWSASVSGTNENLRALRDRSTHS